MRLLLRKLPTLFIYTLPPASLRRRVIEPRDDDYREDGKDHDDPTRHRTLLSTPIEWCDSVRPTA